MKLNRHITPTLLGASALLLSACSYGDIGAPPRTAAASQTHAGGPSELMRIANQLAQNGDHDAAIPLYRHLGAKNGNPAALIGLSGSLIAKGANNEATSILTMLVERGQANGTVWYNLGKLRLANGQFEAALTAFSTASTKVSSDAKIRSGKAIALAALGRTSDAIAAFQTNSDRLTLSNKALILAATGRAEAAIRVLEPIMRLGKGTSRDRQNLAMAYLLAGQDEEAYRIARLDLDPATINETFTFYRSLSSLDAAQRMQALVTGTVNPEWSRSELANLELQDSTSRKAAAKRLVHNNILARAPQWKPKRKMLAKAPPPTPKATPVTKPKPAPVSRADYVLTEVPPLVEPEGWALQIGAYRTLKNLMRGWTLLYRKSGDILEDIPPRRSEIDFGKRKTKPSGFYYRLNAGPLKTFAHARELCTALKARGTSCWIRPPEKTEGNLPKGESVNSAKKPKRITASANTPQ